MLGSLGKRPFQDSAVFTCPVNGLRVKNALERSSIPTGAWHGHSKGRPWEGDSAAPSVSDGLSPVK